MVQKHKLTHKAKMCENQIFPQYTAHTFSCAPISYATISLLQKCFHILCFFCMCVCFFFSLFLCLSLFLSLCVSVSWCLHFPFFVYDFPLILFDAHISPTHSYISMEVFGAQIQQQQQQQQQRRQRQQPNKNYLSACTG